MRRVMFFVSLLFFAGCMSTPTPEQTERERRLGIRGHMIIHKNSPYLEEMQDRVIKIGMAGDEVKLAMGRGPSKIIQHERPDRSVQIWVYQRYGKFRSLVDEMSVYLERCFDQDCYMSAKSFHGHVFSIIKH